MRIKLNFIERLDRTLSGGFLLIVITTLICISLIFPAGDEIYGIYGKL